VTATQTTSAFVGAFDVAPLRDGARMDEYGQHHPSFPARHLRAIEPDDDYIDDAPFDLGACERLEREGRRDSLLMPLIALVGDADALSALDAEPIPDEPFDWSAVDETDRPFLGDVLELTDRACDLLLDVEFRTITRRLVARVARRDPRALRRSPHAARCAAAFVWLAGRANGEFGRRGPRAAHPLWDWFGVSNASDRGRTLRRAAGLEPGWVDHSPWDDELSVGDVSFLHSRYRARLIARRDLLLDVRHGQQRWQPRGDGQVEVQARPATVVAAGRGAASDALNRPLLLIGLGDDLDDAEFFALTIPEAKSLVARVQSALDGLQLSG
jgi:hypothetical protein